MKRYRLTMLKPRLATLEPRLQGQKANGVKRPGSGQQRKALREALFRSEPFCRQCAKQGLRTLAAIRDHIVPLFEGGTDDPSNIQPLCQPCSDAKTAQETRRALGCR